MRKNVKKQKQFEIIHSESHLKRLSSIFILASNLNIFYALDLFQFTILSDFFVISTSFIL